MSKVREDLEALALRPVAEVTAEVVDLPDAPVLIGTEAVLHRAQSRAWSARGSSEGGVAAVVFLDFDAELLAPRFRAAEDAQALLARAARLLGGRGGGPIIVQTRLVDHPVLEAARRADPGLVAERELAVRVELDLPPVSVLAEVSGDETRASTLATRLRGGVGIEVTGPNEGAWLVRARSHQVLCDALAAAGRPAGSLGARLRVDVDPLRV